MSFPEPFFLHSGAAASGLDSMPAAFTGQQRDQPAPLEFPSAAALHWLATPSARPAPEATKAPDSPEQTLPMVPLETALSLQRLADSLLIRAPVSATTVPAVSAKEFSLTTLADRLQNRFSRTDTGVMGSLDLLSDSTLPPSSESREKEGLSGVAALLPSPGLKPCSADFAGSPVPESGAKLSRQPKPATERQGDVFFLETPRPPLELPPSSDIDSSPDRPGDAMHARPVTALPAKPYPARQPPSIRKPAAIPAPPPPLPALVAAPAREVPESATAGGAGLVIGGAVLILLGIYLACQLPMFWLELENSDDWGRRKLYSFSIIYSSAAITVLTLGTGSVLLCRWAPALIHAAGWVAALTTSGIIAATGFHLVNADADVPMPSGADMLQLLAALLLPLACILYYQQESTTTACENAQTDASWTDGLPVPALMVFFCGLAFAAGAAAMLCHLPAYPLAMEPPLTGAPATAAWTVIGLLGLAVSLAAGMKNAAALWLLLVGTLTLAFTLSPAAITAGTVWDQFSAALGRPATTGASSPLMPLLIALIPAPLLLILAMARRAFSSPPPS